MVVQMVKKSTCNAGDLETISPDYQSIGNRCQGGAQGFRTHSLVVVVVGVTWGLGTWPEVRTKLARRGPLPVPPSEPKGSGANTVQPPVLWHNSAWKLSSFLLWTAFPLEGKLGSFTAAPLLGRRSWKQPDGHWDGDQVVK